MLLLGAAQDAAPIRFFLALLQEFTFGEVRAEEMPLSGEGDSLQIYQRTHTADSSSF